MPRLKVFLFQFKDFQITEFNADNKLLPILVIYPSEPIIWSIKKVPLILSFQRHYFIIPNAKGIISAPLTLTVTKFVEK